MRSGAAENREEDQRAADNGRGESRHGQEQDQEKRWGRAERKSGGRGQGRLNGAGASSLGNAELVSGMSREGVVGHELIGDLAGEFRREATSHVDTGQFGPFEIGRRGELAAFPR